MKNSRVPLSKEEVIKAVERRGPARIPLVQARWWGQGLREQHGDRLGVLDERYPEDRVAVSVNPVDWTRMGLSWEVPEGGARDSRCVIDDWAKLDEFIEKLPAPEDDPYLEEKVKTAEQAHADDRYLMFCMWLLFFERPWMLRGMENLMIDYYADPENVHRLHDALCTQYERYLRHAARVLRPDGFWTSDDLGHQNGTMMSPPTFREMIKPYYVRVGRVLRERGMHWWLHSCGNNTALLDDLIDAGVDVFHPVQKGTMDEIAVAREYGDRMTFLVGFDVQHILQEADPEGVRAEMRYLIDTFDRPDGGMCIAAGNGIVSGTPFENIEAFLDEATRYGAAHRQQHAAACA